MITRGTEVENCIVSWDRDRLSLYLVCCKQSKQ